MISVREVQELMAQGWTFGEARMGKGWQDKYPDLAAWEGGYQLSGSPTEREGWLQWTVELHVFSSSRYLGDSTTYVVGRNVFECSRDDPEYQYADAFAKSWWDEHGLDTFESYKSGWSGDPDWEARYPSIHFWLAQGKRHCLSIKTDCVSRKANFKAWHYHKPSNTETVLIEATTGYQSDEQLLQALNSGIQTWIGKNGDRLPLGNE